MFKKNLAGIRIWPFVFQNPRNHWSDLLRFEPILNKTSKSVEIYLSYWGDRHMDMILLRIWPIGTQIDRKSILWQILKTQALFFTKRQKTQCLRHPFIQLNLNQSKKLSRFWFESILIGGLIVVTTIAKSRNRGLGDTSTYFIRI